MWLIIIFILGTLCVVFNEKIGEFFSKIIDLDLIFLSKKEKKIKQQQLALLKNSPEKLFPVYEFILQRYAHTSMKRCRNDYISLKLQNFAVKQNSEKRFTFSRK